MPSIYRIMFFVSLALVAAGVILFVQYGLRLGVDFTGGSVLEVEFTNGRPALEDLSAAFTASTDEVVRMVSLTPVGDNGLVIRSSDRTHDMHAGVLNTLQKNWPDAGLRQLQFDFIGPAVGAELKDKSVRAVVLVLLAVVAYIALVFRAMRRVLSPWVMGVAAIIALLHDVLIPIGVFAWLGHYLDVELSAVFVAAILTILGYSVSDTVVIFDRVRENILRGMKGTFGEIVHISVMQTLVRSLNTTLTTLVALVAIFLFGGESIHYFALALILGIALGAYSSIFVAAPLLVWFGKSRTGRN